MSYYIKGNKERGAEVIALLKSKGAKNPLAFSGKDTNVLYYITKRGTLLATSDESCKSIISNLLEELTLPEPKWEPKFKKGDEVDFVTTLTHGIVTGINYHEKTYTIRTGHVETVADEAHISLHKWEPKRGETVLVRFNNVHPWEEAVFSFASDSNHYHTVGGGIWSYCIPFDESKLGKVTND